MESPISLLPDEILSAIFEAGRQLVHKNSPPFEILVSQLTRRFREIAIRTPGLWTNLICSLRSPRDMVTAYLTRSGALPLDIQVDFTPVYPDDLNKAQEMAGGLVFHVSRWRRVLVHGQRFDYLKAFLTSICSVNAPILRYFQLSTNESKHDDESDDEEGPGGYLNTFDIFTGGAASLTTLRLKEVSIQHCRSPLLSVESIHFHTGPWIPLQARTSLRDSLAGLSALTRLVIHGQIIRGVSLPSSAIVLPALLSLHMLANAKQYPAINLIMHISAPLLHYLYLEEMHETSSLSLCDANIMERFPCLRSVTLTVDADSSCGVLWDSVMASFPAITHFEVLEHEPAFAAAFLDSAANPMILPNLESLSLGCINGDDISDFADALSVRTELGIGLRLLRIWEGADILHQGITGPRYLQQLRQHSEIEIYKPIRWPKPDYGDWLEEEHIGC